MFDKPYFPFRSSEFAERGLSSQTLDLLHGQEQIGLGRALDGFYGQYAEMNGRSLEDNIDILEAERGPVQIRYVLCQYYNLHFSWLSLRADGGISKLPERLKEFIVRDYGSVEAFRQEFRSMIAHAIEPHWIWLFQDSEGRLNFELTTPLQTLMTRKNITPMLCCFLKDRAFIFDHGFDRDAYACNWFDRLANFEYAAERLR